MRCVMRAERILMREGPAARMMGRRFGVTMRMLAKVAVSVGFALARSEATKRSAMEGICVV